MRGLRGPVKKNKIRRLVLEENIDFIALQEAKLEEVSAEIFGGCDQFELCYLPSIGNSGGILSIWNSLKAKLLFSFKDTGFVGVCLEWQGSRRRCFIVNIYSQGGPPEKRQHWEVRKMSKRGFGEGFWCVADDFNVVRSSSERRGSSILSREDGLVLQRDFNQFIEDMHLSDLPSLGRKFTRVRSNGSMLRRLDPFLVSESWLDH